MNNIQQNKPDIKIHILWFHFDKNQNEQKNNNGKDNERLLWGQKAGSGAEWTCEVLGKPCSCIRAVVMPVCSGSSLYYKRTA